MLLYRMFYKQGQWIVMLRETSSFFGLVHPYITIHSVEHAHTRENGEVWDVNHGLYRSTTRSV